MDTLSHWKKKSEKGDLMLSDSMEVFMFAWNFTIE